MMRSSGPIDLVIDVVDLSLTLMLFVIITRLVVPQVSEHMIEEVYVVSGPHVPVCVYIIDPISGEYATAKSAIFFRLSTGT